MALTDRAFVFDGSPEWSPDHAVRLLTVKGVQNQTELVKATLAALSDSLAPVPVNWLADRLAILWSMFMASRAAASSDAVTIWTAEYLRLLGDLPHDIVAAAIDRSVKACRHGFIPSVGEVMGFAEPLLSERRAKVDRLRRLADHMAAE